MHFYETLYALAKIISELDHTYGNLLYRTEL